MILFVAKVLPSCIKSFLLETTPIIIAKHSPRQHTSLGFLSENTAKRPYLIANQMRWRMYNCCHIFILHSSCKIRNPWCFVAKSAGPCSTRSVSWIQGQARFTLFALYAGGIGRIPYFLERQSVRRVYIVPLHQICLLLSSLHVLGR